MNKLVTALFVITGFAKTGITGRKALITDNFTEQKAQQVSAKLLSGT